MPGEIGRPRATAAAASAAAAPTTKGARGPARSITRVASGAPMRGAAEQYDGQQRHHPTHQPRVGGEQDGDHRVDQVRPGRPHAPAGRRSPSGRSPNSDHRQSGGHPDRRPNGIAQLQIAPGRVQQSAEQTADRDRGIQATDQLGPAVEGRRRPGPGPRPGCGRRTWRRSPAPACPRATGPRARRRPDLRGPDPEPEVRGRRGPAGAKRG